jgi:hypothetical protein
MAANVVPRRSSIKSSEEASVRFGDCELKARRQIVTPAGVPHAFQVLDRAPAQVVYVACPPASNHE